jgi:hypothetical protein
MITSNLSLENILVLQANVIMQQRQIIAAKDEENKILRGQIVREKLEADSLEGKLAEVQAILFPTEGD